MTWRWGSDVCCLLYLTTSGLLWEELQQLHQSLEAHNLIICSHQLDGCTTRSDDVIKCSKVWRHRLPGLSVDDRERRWPEQSICWNRGLLIGQARSPRFPDHIAVRIARWWRHSTHSPDIQVHQSHEVKIGKMFWDFRDLVTSRRCSNTRTR